MKQWISPTRPQDSLQKPVLLPSVRTML